jgi:hypothetical protein
MRFSSFIPLLWELKVKTHAQGNSLRTSYADSATRASPSLNAWLPRETAERTTEREIQVTNRKYKCDPVDVKPDIDGEIHVSVERIDWALQITNIVKDISEGSQLLAPLKATCALIIRGLEITRVCN